MKKKKYLVENWYGMGGVAFYLISPSKKLIKDKYPYLEILDEEKFWEIKKKNQVLYPDTGFDLKKYKKFLDEKATMDITSPTEGMVWDLLKELRQNPRHPAKDYRKNKL